MAFLMAFLMAGLACVSAPVCDYLITFGAALFFQLRCVLHAQLKHISYKSLLDRSFLIPFGLQFLLIYGAWPELSIATQAP